MLGDGFGPDNPFGIVPFVYIPHFARAGGHYGQSHVPDLSGMVEELNSRMVDRADGVKNANTNRIWGRNLPASGVVPQKVGETEVLINIGNTPMGSNADEQAKAERDQQMALETQRQNMQMKLQSMAMKRNSGTKSASSRQKDGR
jgi:hypothetical protein